MPLDLELAEKVKAQLDEKIKDAEHRICSGACADFSEYRFSLGLIRGFSGAMVIIDQTQEELLKGDNK